MPESIRVFLGSAGEARKVTDEVATCLRSEGVEVLSWTDPAAFPPGRTFIESLEVNLHRCNAALLIATATDPTDMRGQARIEPRDNLVLEYGMAMIAFGRDRA